MNKTALVIVLAVLVGGTTFYYLNTNRGSRALVPSGPVATSTSAASSTTSAVALDTPSRTVVQGTKPTGKIGVAWKFEDAGETHDALTNTKVTVLISGVPHFIGTYMGSCNEIGAEGFNGFDGKGLLPGEVAGTQCWYAGAGDEIGIFNDTGRLVIKVGELGEGGEGANFRGNFKTALSL